MLKRAVLALVVAVALVVWVAPDVRAAAVGSRFDVTLYGWISTFNTWRSAVTAPDTGAAEKAVPKRVGVTGALPGGVDQRAGQWVQFSTDTRTGLRIAGPVTDLGFLGKPKTSALIEWDWRDDDTSRGGRLRAGLLDFDWAGKTVSTKLRIGLAGMSTGGTSFMLVSPSPWFGGSRGTPFENQITLIHTIALDKTSSLAITWGGFWGSGPWIAGAFREPWSESEQPGFNLILALRTVPYGKVPLLITTDFRWARFEPDLSTTRFAGDQYIWTTAVAIPTPGYGDLIWNAEWATTRGGVRWGFAQGAPVTARTGSNLLHPTDFRVRAATSWWAGIGWNLTKKLTFNAGYEGIRMDPDQVPFVFVLPASVAAAQEFMTEHRGYAFNWYYALSPMVTVAMGYRKYITEFRDSRGPQTSYSATGVPAVAATFDVKDGSADEITTMFKVVF